MAHMQHKGNLDDIKSIKILKQILNNVSKKSLLKLIKINKQIKKKLNIDINDYKDHSEILSQIEIIIPDFNGLGKFINIPEEDKSYYHIFFDDNERETLDKYEIQRKDKIQKIKILIDPQINSFSRLFEDCKCIKKIYMDVQH